MTDDQLIDELARLDAAATKGPCKRPKLSVNTIETKSGRTPVNYFNNRHPDDANDKDYRDTDEADADLFALLFTHRHRLLALLRREKAGRELLERALQSCTNDLLEDEITDHLTAAKGADHAE